MWLIDRTWKPREGWSRPALTVEDNQHHHDEAGKPRRHHGGTNTKSLTRVHDPVPEPPPADRITDFAAAMAQGRRPVPFRTRKLSPGTAMVLCPRGHGRVAHRRNHTSPKARGTHVPRAFPVSRAQRRTPDTDTAEPGEHITPRDLHPMNTPPNRKDNNSRLFSPHLHASKPEEQPQSNTIFPIASSHCHLLTLSSWNAMLNNPSLCAACHRI